MMTAISSEPQCVSGLGVSQAHRAEEVLQDADIQLIGFGFADDIEEFRNPLGASR